MRITDILRAHGVGVGAKLEGDAIAANLLTGKTAMNISGKITGTMPNIGAQAITPSGASQAISMGYHSGAGSVAAVVVPVANVLAGTTIAGQIGTMVNRGAVTMTPSSASQTILQGYHNGSGSVAAVVVPVASVLAGTTIAGQVGTMPNKSLAALAGGYSTAISIKTDGLGSIVFEPPTGYYTSGINANGYGSVIGTDADFIAPNIRVGTNVFGLVGSLAPKLYASGTTTASANFAVTVSGIGFTAKLIYIYRTNYKTNAQYVTIYNASISTANYITWGTAAPLSATMPGGPGYYVDATGFKLEVAAANDGYTWEAYG